MPPSPHSLLSTPEHLASLGPTSDFNSAFSIRPGSEERLTPRPCSLSPRAKALPQRSSIMESFMPRSRLCPLRDLSKLCISQSCVSATSGPDVKLATQSREVPCPVLHTGVRPKFSTTLVGGALPPWPGFLFCCDSTDGGGICSDSILISLREITLARPRMSLSLDGVGP